MRVFIIFFCCVSVCFAQKPDFVKYVNPFVGTGGNGHTYPGATSPFGMVQLSPDTRIDGSWEGCGGYVYSDSIIVGFSHTHLSGTGCSDYGDIMLMPMMGEAAFDNKIYSSKFSHANEKANPGFYSVLLNDDQINVELTSTPRVGFHKYIFNKSGNAEVILDLNHRDKLLEGEIKILNETTIEVYRKSEAWASSQIIYARIVFSRPFKFTFNENKTKAHFGFEVKKAEEILVKVALSTTGYDGAEKNLNAEIAHWDFEKIKIATLLNWNTELSKIEVKGGSTKELQNFYTALYHTMVVPNLNMDVDGNYRGRDNKIHQAVGFTYYSVFSLWDTFRAAHPLYTIIDKKRTLDFIKTFLAQYEQGGRLPVWELMCNETDCMIGYHSVSVITDALLKGFDKFDVELAFEAMKKSANWNHLGLPAYIDHGYLAVEDEAESVSKTLEYAYDDWCVAQVAKYLNKKEDEKLFNDRAQSYKNLFDPKTNFIRPRKNGGWLTPFDPREVNNNYTEANGWQYTFFVPHQINELISMMGGEKNFEKKLDELFSTSSKTTGRSQADITGLIGQYAHGNEPSHHMAYLYNYVGAPWKSQEKIHQIMSEFYSPTPDGLIGNEDCGQMSAWYVFSAMGFYPVTPGLPEYVIGTPLFEEVKINLENKKSFVIKAKNISDKNYYVQNATSPYFLTHQQINDGGEFNFEMGNSPLIFPSFNKAEALFPKSDMISSKIIPSPIIESTSNLFRDSLKITLVSPQNNSLKDGTEKIYYSIGDVDEGTNASLYTKPFIIYKSQIIRAYIISDSKKSKTSVAVLKKFPNNWQVHIMSKFNPQYSAGGNEGIIDGIRADINWKKGGWQGFQDQDFEAIIDMKKIKKIKKVSVGFLQDTRSWILMPLTLIVEISKDGKKYTQVGVVNCTTDPKDYSVQVKDYELNFKNIKARYVRVLAKNFGKLPEWHQGYGNQAFIFVDEISID